MDPFSFILAGLALAMLLSQVLAWAKRIDAIPEREFFGWDEEDDRRRRVTEADAENEQRWNNYQSR